MADTPRFLLRSRTQRPSGAAVVWNWEEDARTTSNAFCRRAVAGLARECDDILGGEEGG